MTASRMEIPGACLLALIALEMVFPAASYATASTHIWGPSTDVQGYGVMHITSDLYLPTERDSLGNRPDTVTNLGLTTGILPLEKLNAEVGFDNKSGLGALDEIGRA